ncbi:MAG: aldo/keto reductase [Oscillospiraceae bacterium]|nr:aldo/keto reductase [Oscillospiraceae bacterium]
MQEKTTVILNNGIEMERIGLGFWESRGQEASGALCHAVEAGYRKIDTAMYYGNEKDVGQGIKNCGLDRKELFVATKLWYTDMCEGRQEETFYKSLEDLGLEYADLYFLHWPIGEVTKSWRVLERLYEAGKARAIGVCNFQPLHLEKLLAKANVCPAVNQIESNPCFQQNGVVEFCQREGIVPEAWAPLGKGRDLSLPILGALAQKYEKTPAQIILRWQLQRGMSVIPKSVHPDRIRQNRAVFDFELEAKDMDAIYAQDTGKSKRGYPEEFHFDRICENTVY